MKHKRKHDDTSENADYPHDSLSNNRLEEIPQETEQQLKTVRAHNALAVQLLIKGTKKFPQSL
jgi:hypothetical protein